MFAYVRVYVCVWGGGGGIGEGPMVTSFYEWYLHHITLQYIDFIIIQGLECIHSLIFWVTGYTYVSVYSMYYSHFSCQHTFMNSVVSGC